MMLKDFSRLKTEFEKVREEYVMTLPAELKLKGIPTSELLEGIPTSELLKSINTAELVEALFSPEVLSEYPPEFYLELERKLATQQAQNSI
ncbi:MAG: hypothetical protein ACKO6N_05230 [Myxococcota bacterium]